MAQTAFFKAILERKLPNYEFCFKENQVQRTQLNNMRIFKGDLHSIWATKQI